MIQNDGYLFDEGNDLEQWFLNYYICETCGNEWIDEWSATCDDECPKCGTIMTPYKFEDI